MLHEYKLTGSQVSAINSIDKPYVFMKSDGDTIFKPAGKLYQYD